MSARSSSPSRVTQLLIEAMAKHLPPSAAQLRLLDIDGKSGAILLGQRPDLEVTAAPASELAQFLDSSFDAVVSFDTPLENPFLTDAMRLLRPGGRLITIDSARDPDEEAVKTLEAAGYDRILIETGAECPLPVGMLARGEKPHTTEDTLARVRLATIRDSAAKSLANFKGRFVHVLVQQTPNVPVWKLQPGQHYAWRAAVIDGNDGNPVMLAFSSLPSAVSFMQEAVLQGKIRDVNKVAKYTRDVAQTWTHGVLLNPTLHNLNGHVVGFVDVDADAAEAPDE